MEVPQIAEDRNLSTLSARNRLFRLQGLVEARTRMDWEARMEKIAQKVRENTKIRRRELERLEAAAQEILELREERAATKFAVEKALVNETKKNF